MSVFKYAFTTIVDAPPEHVIVHQTNCTTKNPHGLGLARVLFEAFPDANVYNGSDARVPGTAVVRGRVAALFGQKHGGKANTTDDTPVQRLQWFGRALQELDRQTDPKLAWAVPYHIGCGLAGGSWKDYEAILQTWAMKRRVVIYHYDLVQALQRMLDHDPPFPVDERSHYHHVVSLIIGQRIRFKVAQTIRRKIYETLGENSLDRIQSLTPEQRREVGLGEDKWKIIAAYDPALDKNKGVGEWTVRCAEIMRGDYSRGWVFGDRAVENFLVKLAGISMDAVRIAQLLNENWPTHEQGRLFAILWNKTR